MTQALFGQGSRHILCAQYRQVNPRKFRRYFKFAFARNPWDRLVSSYFYLKGGGRNASDRQWAEEHLAHFPDFRSFVCGWVSESNIAASVHFIPQVDFITDGSDAFAVDFLGRFETLEKDFSHVAERLKLNARLPRVNEGRHEPYRNYYDSETRDIVQRVYARDIALLGYSFGYEDIGPT